MSTIVQYTKSMLQEDGISHCGQATKQKDTVLPV